MLAELENDSTYRNLNDVRSDEVKVLQTTQDGPQLAGRPSSSLGRTRRRREGRVQSVNVDGEIHGLGGTNTLDNSVDDALGANSVDFTGLDNLKSAVAIVVVVTGSTQGSPDTGVDIGVVGEQAFHGSVVEVGTVVDAGYIRWRSTEDLGSPYRRV